MSRPISIIGARTHNLKNISLDLPRNKLIVITGVSGSGKSSLAFDTLYAEGQRRYVESLSSYARQFLEKMDRPDIDEIRGIAPAVAIEQKNPTRSSRSTVGTATELQDYLRLLFARIGHTFCPKCDNIVRKDRVDDVVQYISSRPNSSKIFITFPFYTDSVDATILKETIKSKGFFRVLFENNVINIDSFDLESTDSIDILVDRLINNQNSLARISDSIDLAFSEGSGIIDVHVLNEKPVRFSQTFDCAHCGISLLEPQPRLFSFNNPFGACPTCNGFGDIIRIDENLVLPDKSKSLSENCIAPLNTPAHREMYNSLLASAPKNGIDINTPYKNLDERAKKMIWSGFDEYPGLDRFFSWLETKRYKIGVRVMLSRYRGYTRCPACNGTRLRPEALNVRISGKNIGQVNQMTLREASDFFARLELTAFDQKIAGQVLGEIKNRLNYLNDIGLAYLTLDRKTATISGGEFQRINLATALGAHLVGSLYILDEPTIGLHPRDTKNLVNVLKALRDLGNTVVVVEHDREMMQNADRIIDLGPYAGENGGNIVFEGTYSGIRKNGYSLTGTYLRGNKMIPLPDKRRKMNGQFIKVNNARENNLQNIDLFIPLGLFVVVTGVSGSGKSSLVHDVLYTGIMKNKKQWKKRVGLFDSIDGIDQIDQVIMVDQSPIGKTPRSNPATYVKAFEPIRQCFASLRAAKAQGFKPGSFSFNVPGGRCETCKGAGVVKVEMQFLADLFLECDVCGGKRYKKDILDIRYKGKNISKVLNMTISEALKFFHNESAVINKLSLLKEVGLGYLKLGQPATTLSGGESQRVKLAAHLGEKTDTHVLYMFDEPTHRSSF